MLYVLKIIRDTRTNQITVSGITPAPDYIAPYNKKYGAYTVEALRVFPNLKSAKLALKWEKLAASNSILSNEKKRKKFKSLAKYAREYIGWTDAAFANFLEVSSASIALYRAGKQTPPTRALTKLQIFIQLYKKIDDSIKSTFPLNLTGNERMTRGGRSDIWKDARRRK